MAGLGGSGLQLVQVDLPITTLNGGTGQTAFTDGQILIGQTSSGGLVKATPTAGSNVGIATGSGSMTISCPYGSGGVIAKLIGANLNVTTDQAINFLGAVNKYVISSIIITNASGTPLLAAGGLYTAAAKAGSAIVAAGQVYTALNTSVVALPLTIAITNTAFVASPLFFSLTTANGSAITADIYVVGTILA